MAWGFIAQVGLWIALFAVNKWLSPKPRQEQRKPQDFGDQQIPRAQEGMPIPLFWGKVRIKSPAVVWVGAMNAEPVRDSSGNYLAYRYRCYMVLVLGMPGRGNHAEGPKSYLNGFFIGDRPAPRHGALAVPDDAPNPNRIEHGQHLTWDTSGSDFFGGAGRGGGIQGQMTFYEGNYNQFIDVPRDNNNNPLVDTTLWPGYRGQAVVTFYNWFIGENPVPEPYSFTITAETKVQLGANPVLTSVVTGDANPISVLYDLLTNGFGRLGIDSARIDVDNWYAVASTLYNERNGVSIVVYNENEAIDLINEIMQQIDGVMFEDPVTRKVRIKLIREDYNPASIPLFDEENTIEVASYSTATWSETFNQVKVIYTDATRNYEESTAVAQNMANAFAQGRVRTRTLRFPGVTQGDLAAKIAARELKAVSVPLARMRIVVNRDGYTLRPGDVFRFSWADYGFVEAIFRVMSIDFGELGDGRISIEAVRDRFAVNYSVFPPPNVEPPVVLPPFPIRERLVTEAPRWLLLQALAANRINNVDAQRGFYLAVPNTNNSFYLADVALDTETSFAADTESMSFPATATVETLYSRSLDPYDTTTGLRIQGYRGDAPPTAISTQSDIAEDGKNLILVGSEIMAFETVTDLGGGILRLNNVWRGLLDTATREHAVGERIYFLTDAGIIRGITRIGNRGLQLSQSLKAKLVPGSSVLLPDDELPYDTIEARQRTLLPYPPCEMAVNGSNAPSAITEREIHAAVWKKRNRLATRIHRGDELAETPEAGTVYDLLAQKASVGFGTPVRVTLASGLATEDITAIGARNLALAGHGAIDVLVRARRVDGTQTYFAWQDALVRVQARVWRNVMPNPRFESGSSLPWALTSAFVSGATGASGGLGGSGYYLNTNFVATTGIAQQDVNISGYLPARMRAMLEVYTRNQGGSSDTYINVELEQRNTAGALIGTSVATGEVNDPDRWTRKTLNIASLHNDVAALRAKISLITAAEFAASAARAAEVILRVGQFTDNLLTNPSFEGSMAGWTNVTNTFFSNLVGSAAYEGQSYAKSNDFSTAECRQDVALPTGYEFSTAVLNFARMNTATSDLGQVILQCLDGSSNVLAEVFTALETISPLNIWQRRQLTALVPLGTATLRVRLVTLRSSGISSDSVFDDFDLRLYKNLDPDYLKELNFSTGPLARALPRSAVSWRLISDVVAPNYGIWDGDTAGGRLGAEPVMDDTSLLFAKNKFVGPWDGSSIVDDAYELTRSGSRFKALDPLDPYANFGPNESFSAMVVLRSDEDPVAAAAGILGRLGATGWALETTSGGAAQARLVGASGTATATRPSTPGVRDGAMHLVGIVYDSVLLTLTVFDERGATSVSTAGIGDFRSSGSTPFGIGGAEDTTARWPGQISKVYLWRGVALSHANLVSWWQHGKDPTGKLTTYSRAEPLAVVVAGDADGVLVQRYAPDQVALGKDIHTGSWGLVAHKAYANLVPSQQFSNTTYWTAVNSPTVTQSQRDVEGFRRGVKIEGTSGMSLRLSQIPLAADFIRVIWFARADVAHTAQLKLLNASGVLKETYNYAVTTQWQMFTRRLDAWDASTPTGRLEWTPSHISTPFALYLSGPIVVYQGSTVNDVPYALPLGPSGAFTAEPTIRIDETYPVQLNHEGEILVDGTCPGFTPQTGEARPTLSSVAELTNTITNADRRELHVLGSFTAAFLHYDGSSSGVDSSVLPVSSEWRGNWTMRGRWCRAQLLDNAVTPYAGVRLERSSVFAAYGRTSSFSASATPMARLRIGGSEASQIHALIRRIRLSSREEKLVI